jgi:hypothetical protein
MGGQVLPADPSHAEVGEEERLEDGPDEPVHDPVDALFPRASV